jgi:uncharacterized membrane-anchored protein
MRRRSKFKVFLKANEVLDNLIAVIVYVVVAGFYLFKLYHFVQAAVRH